MRRRLAAGLAVAGVAVAVLLITDPFRSEARDPGTANRVTTSFATVERRSLSSQAQVSGTLGYAGSSALVNQASGTYTSLPRTGAVVAPGQVLYRVDMKPVVLLRGRTPAYRALSSGMSGADVQELNASLVELGYATRAQLDPASDDFGWATKYALERLQRHLEVTQSGSLALGAAVFLPRAARITSVSATLGGAAAPGPMGRATSTLREVVVALEADRQGAIRAGDRVDITLADNRVTRGVVSRVGRAGDRVERRRGRDPRERRRADRQRLHPAAAPPRHRPPRPGTRAGRDHDQHGAPCAGGAGDGAARAALGLRGRGRRGGGARRLVPVQLGLFDDANGLVQVTGALRSGQRVVVPATT